MRQQSMWKPSFVDHPNSFMLDLLVSEGMLQPLVSEGLFPGFNTWTRV